MSLWINWDY